MSTHPEEYIGDAVYASFDGWQIKLRTGDGNNQVIYLEPSVLSRLVEYARRITAEPEPSEPDEPPEPDGECYRGGEAASALAEEQAEIQRTLK